MKDINALALSGAHAALAQADGRARALDPIEAAALLAGPSPVLLCHALFTARPLRVKHLAAPVFDVMELFAFVHPASFCVPTPPGLARFLGLPPPKDAQAAALCVRQAAEILIKKLADIADEDAAATAAMMRRGGWLWGDIVCRALPPKTSPAGSAPAGSSPSLFSLLSRRLPEWHPLKSFPKKKSPDKNHERDFQDMDYQRAVSMLKKGLGAHAEPRAGQMDYMRNVMKVFAPRRSIAAPPALLAEADTGIGKTMGYLVPALLASEVQDAPVWIVTYTRALQSQIDRESGRLVDRAARAKKIAMRKGRENYLCLLNFEESLRVGGFDPVLMGLVARWLMHTRDGDIKSGDFPSWLVSRGQEASWLSSLTDRRQTCIHSACPHYRRCFVEHQRVASARADITIANHALVLSHSLFQNPPHDSQNKPPYYIFDEGHHIFSAADSAFSFHLTGRHMADLRHWLMGADTAMRGAAARGAAARGSPPRGSPPRGWASRGLASRMDDILSEHNHLKILLDEACHAARFLPQSGWQYRIVHRHPSGAAEEFLDEIRGIVLSRASSRERSALGGYSLEAEMVRLKTADGLKKSLERLREAMNFFAAALAALDEDGTSSASSIERVLTRWVEHDLPVWSAMSARASQSGGLVQWIDRLVIERDEGREVDIGMCRHALDPARAFAQNILAKSSGTLITSASLRVTREASAWSGAEQRSGVHHLPYPAQHVYVASPFDYSRQARVFIASDVSRDDHEIARAMGLLFSASRGGGLGLWTAVSRLKAAHGVIADHMRRSGRLLLAQHVDPMAVDALMDIFREDEASCLLGTDALRDGIDVPGASLRLIVFDRVPWPRPDILHRARRVFFGRRSYDDMIAGLRLQQAFGRLIRRQTDRGVFVLLDRAFPSRLSNVFPAGIEISRLPLAQILRQIRIFFNG